MSQNLPQICTASTYVYRKSILKQMYYRFAENFGTLSNTSSTLRPVSSSISQKEELILNKDKLVIRAKQMTNKVNDRQAKTGLANIQTECQEKKR